MPMKTINSDVVQFPPQHSVVAHPTVVIVTVNSFTADPVKALHFAILV